MARSYFRLKFDVGNYRDVESHGPYWLKNEFYGEEIGVSKDGPLDTRRAKLTFDAKQDLPIADFNSVMTIPSCTREKYETHLRDLVEDHVITFPCKIGSEQHVLFRPKTFLDIVDLQKSRYLERETRGPYAFKEIAIRTEPPENIPIFAIEPPKALRYDIIVDDRFVRIVNDNKFSGLVFQKVLPPETVN